MAAHYTLIDDQALAWLVKLNSGTMSEVDQQAFWAWLHTSATHQAAYVRAETLWQRADIVATLASPSATKIRYKKSVNSWPNWAIACSVFLVLITAGIFAIQAAPTGYHLATGIGEQRQVTLEDGTRVLLNTNSQLDVEYTDKHRLATLARGEVYFDVQANPQRPFDVVTGFGMVRVLGTHFAVNLRADDATVTVVDGRVALGKLPNLYTEFSPLIELQRNQQLSLQQAYAGAAALNLDATLALTWRDKQLIFQKQKLAQVVTELNRYFNIQITLADAAVADREITAVIQLSDLNTTLAALCQPLNLRAEFYDGGRQVKLIARAR